MPIGLGGTGVLFLVLGIFSPWLFVVGAIFLIQAAVYLHTTIRGKLLVWEDLLDALDLRGSERALDLGCGRGAVLVALARRLPQGQAVGIDLWRSKDQTGNAEEVTRANAVAAGVDSRVELHTGDMTSLPFPDASCSSLISGIRPTTHACSRNSAPVTSRSAGWASVTGTAARRPLAPRSRPPGHRSPDRDSA